MKEPVRVVYTEEDSTNKRNLPQGILFGWVSLLFSEIFWSFEPYFLGFCLFVCLFVCFSLIFS